MKWFNYDQVEPYEQQIIFRVTYLLAKMS